MLNLSITVRNKREPAETNGPLCLYSLETDTYYFSTVLYTTLRMLRWYDEMSEAVLDKNGSFRMVNICAEKGIYFWKPFVDCCSQIIEQRKEK